MRPYQGNYRGAMVNLVSPKVIFNNINPYVSLSNLIYIMYSGIHFESRIRINNEANEM